MKMPDFDRAFPPTPDRVREAVERGFQRAQRRARLRRAFLSGASIAAALLIVFGIVRFARPRAAARPPILSPLAQSQSEAEPGRIARATDAPAPQSSAARVEAAVASPAPTEAPSAPQSAAAPAEIAEASPAPTEAASSPAPTEAATEAPAGEDMQVVIDAALPDDAASWVAGEEAFNAAVVGELPLYEADAPTEVYADLTVYYTPNGNFCHLDAYCSGMSGAQPHSYAEAVAAMKPACPYCFDLALPAADALSAPDSEADPVYVDPYNDYFHRSPDCFGASALSICSLADARAMEKRACPYCLSELCGEDDAGPARYVNAEAAQYYHESPDCPDLGDDARIMGEAVAQAQGMTRCPRCASAMPEHCALFDKAFGEPLGVGLNELYFGDLLSTEWNESFSYRAVYERSFQMDGATCWHMISEGYGFFPIYYRPAGAALDAHLCIDLLRLPVEQRRRLEARYRVSNMYDLSLRAQSYSENTDIYALCVYFDEAGEISGYQLGIHSFDPSGQAFGRIGYRIGPDGAYYPYDYGPAREADAAGEPYPRLADANAIYFYTPGGEYYHAANDCSNMENAAVHSDAEALVSGKSPCPVCLANAAASDAR